MNKQLTLQDKQKLIKMLKAHYQIKCESFINAIVEDETEKTDLTLKAFSMAMPKIEEIKNPLDNDESKSTDGDVTIKITHQRFNQMVYSIKNKIIVEINGIRHKLIKTKVKDPCDKCSISNVCKCKMDCGFMPCTFYPTRYRKCKPGE